MAVVRGQPEKPPPRGHTTAHSAPTPRPPGGPGRSSQWSTGGPATHAGGQTPGFGRPPPWSAEIPPSYPADASETGTQTQEEKRERKSKGKVLVSGTHGSIPSVSGLIYTSSSGKARCVIWTRIDTHTQTHSHRHTEPGKSLYHWLPPVSKKLTRACPDFNKDLLTVLHFSQVFKAILIS